MQKVKPPSQVLNRKPEANSLLAPTPRAASAGCVAQGALLPVQARFGHDFSRLALTADTAMPVQREAAPEEELQMKANSSATVQRTAPDEEELQMKANPSAIQREAAPEEELQMKADPAVPVQREAAPEEELQMKADGARTVQRAQSGTPSKPNTTGLPNNLKVGVESLSGMSLDDVNVHYNSSAPKAVGALAYAQGTDIHVASGQEEHLPHEAWHVVQQKQGRVQPTFQMMTTEGGSGVVQHMGKAGHIAIGALIGTVIPVIGTIIGGYIGYRRWRSRQPAVGAPVDAAQGEAVRHVPQNADRVPALDSRGLTELQALQNVINEVPQSVQPQPVRSGKRKFNEGDDGKRRATDNPRALLAWIDEVGAMIRSQNFQEAYDLLIDPANGNIFGFEISIYYYMGNPVEVAEKNKSEASKRSIKLYITHDTGWLNTPETAMAVLPMHLEEYMHQYQAMSNNFMSRNTETFKSQSDLPDMAEKKDFEAADYDEIDVMAKLIDMGFDVEEIDYIERYEEREKFWEWWNQ